MRMCGMNRRRNDGNELFMPLSVALLSINITNRGIIIIMFLNIISSVFHELRLSIGVTVWAIDTPAAVSDSDISEWERKMPFLRHWRSAGFGLKFNHWWDADLCRLLTDTPHRTIRAREPLLFGFHHTKQAICYSPWCEHEIRQQSKW